MSQCPNCKSKLSCGCQKRVASNGAQVCTMCLNAYEQTLKVQKAVKTTNTSPTNVKVSYNPGKGLGEL